MLDLLVVDLDVVLDILIISELADIKIGIALRSLVDIENHICVKLEILLAIPVFADSFPHFLIIFDFFREYLLNFVAEVLAQVLLLKLGGFLIHFIIFREKILVDSAPIVLVAITLQVRILPLAFLIVRLGVS